MKFPSRPAKRQETATQTHATTIPGDADQEAGAQTATAPALLDLDRRYSDQVADWLMDARQCHGGMLICSGLSIICALTLQPAGFGAAFAFAGLALFCDRERRRAEREIIHEDEVNRMAGRIAAERIVDLESRELAMEASLGVAALRHAGEAGDDARANDDASSPAAYVIFVREFVKEIEPDGPSFNGVVVRPEQWRRG